MNRLVNFRSALPLFITLLLITGSIKPSYAQHVGAARSKNDSTPPPPTYRPRGPLPDSVIEEKLVQLALQGPQYLVSDHQVNISKDQLSKAKKSWLNLLSVSANYNDQTFAKQNPTAGTYVYPKYFFGLTIPLGVIFAMGPEIKVAREGVYVAQNNQELLARNIRADVLTKYRQYKTYETLVAIQNDAAVDEQAALSLLENKVHNGTASIEQYNIAHKAYGEELSKGLNLKLQRDMSKIDLERMIGTKLENVIK